MDTLATDVGCKDVNGLYMLVLTGQVTEMWVTKMWIRDRHIHLYVGSHTLVAHMWIKGQYYSDVSQITQSLVYLESWWYDNKIL